MTLYTMLCTFDVFTKKIETRIIKEHRKLVNHIRGLEPSTSNFMVHLVKMHESISREQQLIAKKEWIIVKVLEIQGLITKCIDIIESNVTKVQQVVQSLAFCIVDKLEELATSLQRHFSSLTILKDSWDIVL